jgi:4-carboxymuconolactone decarboxylase
MGNNSRRTEGIKIMDLLDPEATDRLKVMIGEIAPDMVDYVLDFAYGDVMARPGLDLETRELCIIASLVALGTEPELKIHLRKALHIGVDKTKILEVLIQQTVYSGFPKAINDLMAAKEVFQE